MEDRMVEPTDHLDRIMAQWRCERPDLDVSALGTLGRLLRTAQLADSALAEGLKQYRLPPGWFDLLAALRRAGRPYQLNPTELAQAMMLSSGGMTKCLDRMAGAGLIERRADPNDRRGTLVALTRKGKAIIDRAIGDHLANEKRLLRPLRADHRRALDQLLRRLLVSLEADSNLGSMTTSTRTLDGRARDSRPNLRSPQGETHTSRLATRAVMVQ